MLLKDMDFEDFKRMFREEGSKLSDDALRRLYSKISPDLEYNEFLLRKIMREFVITTEAKYGEHYDCVHSDVRYGYAS